MGTLANPGDMAAALFGKTRREVLGLLFGRPDQWFYLREVVRHVRAGSGAVQRELKRLADAGVIVRQVRGHQVFYQANRQSPLFPELQGLLIKTVGVIDTLRAALMGLAGRIDVAFLYGSMAKGRVRGDSDVDVLVVGEVTFAELVSSLGPAQERVGRDVNPTLYPPSEFCRKLAEHHHFLTSVLREPKVFLIGDDHELARLAQGGMAGRASNQSTRGRRLARRSRP